MNSSAVLKRGLRVSGFVYFAFVVVRIVAVTRQRVQGNLAMFRGVELVMIFGLGLIGSLSAVFAA